ncbi:Copia protein [Trichinella sp. T9]|nr:Copia protein [Trichinella sp. T9]
MKLWTELKTTLPHCIRSLGATQPHCALTMEESIINQRLRSFLREKGIEHQFSAPYTPQQNGAAERKNRALVEMAKCMLTDAKLPERFWGETVCTAAYLQNRLPSRSILKTPFELGTGIKPNVEHIRIFGSKAYSYIPKQKRRKWDNKAREGVIVGYGGTTKGYRLLNPTTNETWISRSVKIIEDDSHMKNESAVPKGAIERSREYEDIPKLLKKEDNVIQAQKANVPNDFQTYLEFKHELQSNKLNAYRNLLVIKKLMIAVLAATQLASISREINKSHLT